MSLTQWKTCSTTLRAADLAVSATRSSSPTCERLLATTRGEPSLRDGPEGRRDHGLYDPAAPGQVAKLARGRGVGDLEGRHADEGAHRRRVPDLVLALAVGEAEARATPRACTRSPTLGLPIAGSAPLAPASALRASPARASQASPGQDSEGRSGNRGRLVPRFRPMPISASENANCVMRIPPA